MKTRLLAAASLGIGLSTFASLAYAWTPISSSRPTWSGPVPFSMNTAGSVDLGPTESQTQVRAGMTDWTTASCSPSLEASWQGTTSRQPGTYEGTSTIGWIESGWDDDPSAIGVTGPTWGGRDATINEADMSLNGVNFEWITGSGRGDRVNTYSIILHEGGHYYGLGHSSESGATMYFAYSGGIDSLQSDDAIGICTLYPGPSGPPSCEDVGCSPGLTCVGGECVRPSGDGTFCSPCESGSDCDGGVCLGYPDSFGYCGRDCTSNADCGSNGFCVGVRGGSNQCVRADSAGNISCDVGASTGCSSDSDCDAGERCNRSTGECEMASTTGGGIGDECGDDSECNSGTCFRGTCSQTCNWVDTGSCPSGFYCNGDATGTCGDGLCVAGTAGRGALGTACSGDTDCTSLYCADDVCASPCTPGGATGCPAGFACQGSEGGCGACKQAGGAGDICETGGDCLSEICAVPTGESGFCTENCTTDSDCPTSFTCEASGSNRICTPTLAGLGADCGSNDDCLSGICATENGDRYCTRICTDSTPCPGSTFSCDVVDETTSVCSPLGGGADDEGRGGCACTIAPRGASSPLAFVSAMLLGAAVLRRRRRRSGPMAELKTRPN